MKTYSTISEFLDALNVNHGREVDDFFIFRIEDYFHRMPMEMDAYKKDFFQITYGEGHNMDIRINSSSYNPVERMLSFSTPYHVKSWKVKDVHKDSLSYMVLFKPAALDPLFHGLDVFKNYRFFNLNSVPAIKFSEEDGAVIENLLATLQEEFNNLKTIGSKKILSAYLSIILEKTNLFFNSPDSNIIYSNRAEEIAFEFENLLKQKCNYQLHLGDYAGMLNISTTYLSEAVKKATGKSAKSIATDMLILQAKSLLLQNKDTVAAIAENIGFNDASNFVKFFKSNTNITPTQFRKQL